MPATIGQGLRIARGQDERQQLGLVAELAQGDDGGGNEEGFEHRQGDGPSMLLS